MKNVIMLTFLFISFVQFSSAQNCKFFIDKVDPISGKKTQKIIVKNVPSSALLFSRNGDDLSVDINIYLEGQQLFELPEGSQIDLKLGDNTILNLPSAATTKPVPEVAADRVVSNLAVAYKLTAAQAKQIISAGVTFVRIHLQGDKTQDVNFKEGETAKTKEKAKCIFE